ncbi:uncharacterized protein [Panulirus ornatus]|uniref:uncharacterized protein n=1 Tax=Panulirus ornatus TaxID=150431 RepID=UPI003A87BFE6
MKVLVLFALVAFATAKPQYWWPHTTPLVTVKSTDVASPIIPYAGLPWTHGLFPYSLMAAAKPAEERAKRSAEADPEADPQILYTSSMSYPYAGNAWAYHGPWTWPYGVNPLLTVAKPAEETRAKRSADAEPEADPFLLYSSGISHPYTGYPWAYNTFPYNWHYGMRPLVTVAKPAEAARAKRSADAEPEADPFLLYSAGTYPYTGYPWAYNTFPYNWPYGINRLV